MSPPPAIFDAHLDLAWNALSWNRDLTLPLNEIRRRESHMTDHRARGHATTCLPEMRRAEVRMCLATLLARCNPDFVPSVAARIDLDHASVSQAYAVARGQLAYYEQLQRDDEIELVCNREQLLRLDAPQSTSPSPPSKIGCILAMEGADPITAPAQAEHWWKLGLRVVGLAHYGRSAYAGGTGSTAPLTAAGVELLGMLDRLGMILDLTHLSDASFCQAIDVFPGRVMSSHTNARALVPGVRQFSDEQIRLLIQRGAVLGIACDSSMLHAGYQRDSTPREQVPLDAMVDHIDHICQLSGSCAHVAVGSDLDGGYGFEQTPLGLDSIADLHRLKAILHRRGFTDDQVHAIFLGNWMRFFCESLPTAEAG